MIENFLVFEDQRGRVYCTIEGECPDQPGCWTCRYVENIDGQCCTLSKFSPQGFSKDDWSMYLSLVRRKLGSIDSRWLWQDASVLMNAGAELVNSGDLLKAQSLYEQAEDVMEPLLVQPGLTAGQVDLALSCYRELGTCLMAQGDRLSRIDQDASTGKFSSACVRFQQGLNLIEALSSGTDLKVCPVAEDIWQDLAAKLDLARTKEATPQIWIIVEAVEQSLIGADPDDPVAQEAAELAEGQLETLLETSRDFWGERHFLTAIILCQLAECRRILGDQLGAVRYLTRARLASLDSEGAQGELRTRIEAELQGLSSGSWGDEYA